MKHWMIGRRFMAEVPDNGGAGGGGGGGGENTPPTNTPPANGGGENTPPANTPPANQPPENKGGGEELNELGKSLNAGGGENPPPNNQQPEPGKEQQPPKADEPPTEAEAKAYAEALKLDEETFGKGQQFDSRYVEKLPALFKKYGLPPDKANALANDFAKIQKEVEEKTAEKQQKFAEWRAAEMKKMNADYLATYDKAGRADIERAILHFFPKGSAMLGAVVSTEVGVDPGFLKAMKFIGERLPKDAAPGAASGAGAGSGKSLSDSFMGL